MSDGSVPRNEHAPQGEPHTNPPTNAQLLAELEKAFDTTRTIASVLWNRATDEPDWVARGVMQNAYSDINGHANWGLRALNYMRIQGFIEAADADRAARDARQAGEGQS